ncbi:MAG: DUF1573 domain-containing protein [Planctomycetaceae bacterium]|nr:DUF1573 domain-containing protein [Planctomycetaceae bacterium]
MKRKTGRRWFYGLAVLLGTQPAWAQPGIWAEKMFDKLDHDFGVVARGAEAKYRLTITNRFKPEVHIAFVRTSCGCTAAKPSKDTLASLEEAYIELTMDTNKFSNQKDSSVTIVIDRPQHAEVRIPVRAFIRADVVLTPGAAEFGSVIKGADAQRKVAVAHTGRDSWTIKQVISKNPNIAASVVQTARGNGHVNYDLVVSVKGSTPLGDLREQLTLITDDQGNPNISVVVNVRVENEYSVPPSLVDFGTLAPGVKKTIQVAVAGKSKKPFAIEKVEAENSAGRFEVQLPVDSRPIHLVLLTIIAPAEAGTLADEITVTIVGHAEPVTFKTRLKVVVPPTSASTTTAGSATPVATPTATPVSTPAATPAAATVQATP